MSAGPRTERTLLFVYGTLKRGESQFHLLTHADWLNEIETGEGYALVDCGEYPAMVEEGTGRVLGELVEIPRELLSALDAYEGAPELFQRTRIRLENGERAVGYVIRESTARRFPRIPSGVWPPRPRS